MKLTVQQIDGSGLVRLAAEGDVTILDANPITNPLLQVLGPQWASYRVVLSMAKCAFVDSSAIGWLLNCQKEFAKAGGIMVIYAAPKAVRQTLDLLRLREALKVVDDEAAAHAMIAAQAQGAGAK
jgi:anti-anti-sigma factor